MSNRKKTPDLLHQILTGHKEDPTASRTLDTSKSSSQQDGVPEAEEERGSNTSGVATTEKIKGTYYLSPDGANAIDDMWYNLRKLVAPENRGQISKSLIVDIAVQLALEEFEENGRASEIASRIGL